MTDYGTTIRRSLPKRVAIWLLEQPWINAPVVGVVRNMKGAAWRARLPVMREIAQIGLPGGQTISMLNPSRCHVAREIWWNDGQLSHAADRLALDLAIGLSRDADLFLDIGSYTGIFALSVARCNPMVRSCAFEIVPDNFLLLWQNVIHNNLIGRVEVIFKGAGERPGTILLPAALEAGVLPSSVALDSDSPDGIEVPVDSVDRMIDRRDGRVVIKIDVEGFEWSVISGARALISSCRPDIICEFLTRAPQIPEITQHLMPLGYEFYHITGDGLLPAVDIFPVKSERDWLLTVRPREELERLGWTIL